MLIMVMVFSLFLTDLKLRELLTPTSEYLVQLNIIVESGYVLYIFIDGDRLEISLAKNCLPNITITQSSQ